MYGAALGDQFAVSVTRPRFFHTNALQAIKKHGTCMFVFTSARVPSSRQKKNKTPILIPLDLTKLPHVKDRRNVKELKFNPTSLFPWAKRIIWQDVKILDKNKFGYSLPVDYLGRYNETVERHGVCASFTGLPFHRSTVGKNAQSMTLKDHCDAIVDAKASRKTVTDNVDILIAQCNMYYKKYSDMSVQGAQVFHEHPMIDSAFMMFDMQTERCRQYNADLLCAWLKEIRTYSDRDQVSFSTALASSRVHLVDCNNNNGTASNRNNNEEGEVKWAQLEEGSVVDIFYDENKNERPGGVKAKATVLEMIQHDDSDSRYNVIRHFDDYLEKNLQKKNIRLAKHDAKVYSNEVDERVVYISDPSCHWYTSRRTPGHLRPNRCYPNMGRVSSLIPKKVALIVAGTQKRFLINSTLEYVIAPMEKMGIEVDYYLSLITTNETVAYRSENSYMNHVSSDLHPMTPKALKDFIQESMSNVGSHATVTIRDDINLNPPPIKNIKKALREYPYEDPYLHFPMVDSRTEDVKRRTGIGNKNLLKMHFAIKALWNDVLLRETISGSKYDIVIFMRDDTLWLGEFNISVLLSNGRVGDDVFIPSCDARIPPLHPMEMNDHIIIAKRSAADIFGDYYRKLLEVDTHECMSRLDNRVTKNGLRGCNSEMLLKFVMDKEGVKVRKVPQSLIPFQRAVRMNFADGSAKYCFHKFCQSKSSPLQLTGSIGLCKDQGH